MMSSLIPGSEMLALDSAVLASNVLVPLTCNGVGNVARAIICEGKFTRT
jgi:hypothetical protein